MVIGLILDDTLDKPDGVQQAVVSIGEKFRSQGHDVHYIVPRTSRTDLQNVHVVGSYFSLKFNGNSVRTPFPASGRKIKALFKEIDFDVLHIQMPYSPFLGAKVLKKAPKKVRKFGTFHILPFNTKTTLATKLLSLILVRNLKLIDRAFATSMPSLQFMRKSFRTDGSVLPNPVDVNFFESFKKEQSLDAKKQIVFLGRFEERKGVRQLLLAYEFLDTNSRSISKLTMVGKGPLLDELKQFSAQKNLGVDFPGFVTDDEKAQYLTNADIAVFPSTSGESFGIVLTEAMAAHSGVVLGGNNPGYASVLMPWPQTLFNPDDMESFVQKLTYYIHADGQRKKDGDSQNNAVWQYDINKVCEQLLQAYQEKITQLAP